jgi:hypothetical protein
MVEEPLPGIEDGLNPTVAPPGNPLTAKPTVPANPLSAVMLTL